MLHTIGYFAYLISVKGYFFLVRCLSPFHDRAGKLWQGQKGALDEILQKENKAAAPSIWFHVASLGEFEQGRPVMQALKEKHPEYRLVVTFFSPSGYEPRVSDPLCDAVYYLPFESKYNARKVIDAIQPAMAFWVKYDFWYFYLRELELRNIPRYLIAAQFRKEQIFFKWYGTFKLNLLRKFNFIFSQNLSSSLLLTRAGIETVEVSGDNRFDRVAATVEHMEAIHGIAEFTKGRFTLIAGSSYEEEERMVDAALQQIQQPFCVILAPHFVNDKRIDEIMTRFKNNAVRYSSKFENTDARVLVIDQIGLLARLYRYGDAALIGGGFWENGLHNTLEAAAFGMPLAFGPKIRRFPEAQDLNAEEIATVVNGQDQFVQWLRNLLQHPDQAKKIAEKSHQFIFESRGATQKVLQRIEQLQHS